MIMKKIILITALCYANTAFSQETCEVWNHSDPSRKHKTFVDAQWTGNIEHGRANGHGTVYFNDGVTYEGRLIEGFPNGQGKMLVLNTIIISDYSEGTANGKTVLIWLRESGRMKYISGNCINGHLNGKWEAYDSNGYNIGYVTLENNETVMQLHSYDNVSFSAGKLLGAIAGVGAGLGVGIAAIAAASTSSELFLLIIIF